MPYLRVHSVGLPREIKRTLATELTQTVVEARHLRGIERDGCTIEFSAIAPDDLAIGGKLIANGRLPDYAVEYRDHDLSRRDKRKLARRITETMSHVLALRGEEIRRVNVLFTEYQSDDFAVGGTILRELWKSRLGRVLGRMARVVRRKRRKRLPAPAVS
jgi:phenylpyruvate tautomerase PptA (4-oxalocrotonate tautomerase family)